MKKDLLRRYTKLPFLLDMLHRKKIILAKSIQLVNLI